MSNGISEWLDTSLSRVIYTCPQYISYDLYAYDEEGDGQGPENYFLGAVYQVFDEYKHRKVYRTSEREKKIWLESTSQELGID